MVEGHREDLVLDEERLGMQYPTQICMYANMQALNIKDYRILSWQYTGLKVNLHVTEQVTMIHIWHW